MKCCTTHAYTMLSEAQKKPSVMRRTGLKSMPALRSAGYTTTTRSLVTNESSRFKERLTVQERNESEHEDGREVLH